MPQRPAPLGHAQSRCTRRSVRGQAGASCQRNVLGPGRSTRLGSACCRYPEGLWGARLTGGSVTPARASTTCQHAGAMRAAGASRNGPREPSQLLGHRPVVSWDGKVRLRCSSRQRPRSGPSGRPRPRNPRRCANHHAEARWRSHQAHRRVRASVIGSSRCRSCAPHLLLAHCPGSSPCRSNPIQTLAHMVRAVRGCHPRPCRRSCACGATSNIRQSSRTPR